MKRANCLPNRSPLEKIFLTLYCIIIVVFLLFSFYSSYAFYHGKLKLFELIIAHVTYLIFLVFSFFCYKRVLSIDPSTRIANYLFFMRHIAVLYKQNLLKDFTLFFINLKDFKFVNKQLNRNGGNLAMYQYAHTLKNFTKRKELVARIGGDNYLAIIRTERVQEFLDLIEEIRVTVSVDGKNYVIPITCRAGISTGTETTSAKDFIDQGNAALRFARENKILRGWYKAELHNKLNKNRDLIQKFDSSIKNNEFIVYYQAKTDMKTGKVIGAEALSRWNSQEGMLYPNEYIQLFEDEGLIISLDFYTLDYVCKDLARWQKSGKQLVKVSVNFSRLHFHDENFANHILKIIDSNGIDHKYIEIEITESAGYEDFDVLRSFVQRMKDEGIGVSIDDFGTGFSALSLIKELPVDMVKLDKSFLNDVNLTRNEDLDFLRNLVFMIKGMNMNVICEGVETEGQKDILLNSGCEYAQGYLFSKPCASEEFEKCL